MRGGEYKCRAVKRHWKLRDQQLKTITYIYQLLYKNLMGDFPGGPVAKTSCSQCREPRFNPWSGN